MSGAYRQAIVRCGALLAMVLALPAYVTAEFAADNAAANRPLPPKAARFDRNGDDDREADGPSDRLGRSHGRIDLGRSRLGLGYVRRSGQRARGLGQHRPVYQDLLNSSLEATPELKQVAHNRLSDESDFSASPAVSDGQLVLRSDEYLYCVEAK